MEGDRERSVEGKTHDGWDVGECPGAGFILCLWKENVIPASPGYLLFGRGDHP